MNLHSTGRRAPGFVLASASPARAALLRQIGLRFEVVPSRIREDDVAFEGPVDKVRSLSRTKAQHVAELVKDKVIIAADTVVVLGEDILGKPENQDDAKDMLNLLSGRWHHVVTGLTVLDTYTGASCTSHEVTAVRMKELSPFAIRAYVKSGEPLGKAGAYAIQGRGGMFIESIEGCYFNVVGLPLAKLVNIFCEIGINIYDELFGG
ncbi:MAG: septum formation inhibitor Maf [Firmicutes bacterium]|nr:septum formation inhibitor Maf [Bacillota bacterium]HXL04484.1 Maf family protein [Bacillota bacterium]